MSKRKQNADIDSDDDNEVSLINVDFEFFDPHPDVDFLALKRLILQLFQTDAEFFQPHDLAELILSQPLIGSTVKTDGRESDPYAYLTVLNTHVHKEHPSIKALVAYALAKSEPDAQFHATLQNLLGPNEIESQNHVGFVFSERLINMPPQIVPHMYRMLADEIQWAIADNEPYRFTHLLIVSRTYRLSDDEAAELQSAPTPKTKKQRNAAAPQPPPGGGVFSYHHEDEYTQKFATHWLDYKLSNAPPRDKESFGLEQGGRLILLPAEKLPEYIATIGEAFAAPS
ncbi:hypothetical protein FA95DRAFT_1561711 [Auriscalpium vulgare]|uniref:Uncharacterized protein n=1 Tax=Auriscalpium vulgare TaxID=40419 RepID=A0ACB8RKU4_9AGAM|nr:hypothetical protein FA95DRAFT_1561711 [Auriscalpium vulgare]